MKKYRVQRPNDELVDFFFTDVIEITPSIESAELHGLLTTKMRSFKYTYGVGVFGHRVFVWDLNTGEYIRDLLNEDNYQRAILLNDWLVVLAGARLVLYDILIDKFVRTLHTFHRKDKKRELTSVGTNFFVCSGTTKLIVWNTETDARKQVETNTNIRYLTGIDSNRFVVSFGHKIWVMDTQLQKLQEVAVLSSSMAFIGSGRVLLLSRDTRNLHEYDTKSQTLTRRTTNSNRSNMQQLPNLYIVGINDNRAVLINYSCLANVVDAQLDTVLEIPDSLVFAHGVNDKLFYANDTQLVLFDVQNRRKQCSIDLPRQLRGITVAEFDQRIPDFEKFQ